MAGKGTTRGNRQAVDAAGSLGGGRTRWRRQLCRNCLLPAIREVSTMKTVDYHYDREADVLYFTFGQSEHVLTVELSEYLLLRFDKGATPDTSPFVVGLTVLFPSQLLALGHRPMQLDLGRLYRLPSDLQSTVLELLASPPLSDLLTAELTFAPDVTPLRSTGCGVAPLFAEVLSEAEHARSARRPRCTGCRGWASCECYTSIVNITQETNFSQVISSVRRSWLLFCR